MALLPFRKPNQKQSQPNQKASEIAAQKLKQQEQERQNRIKQLRKETVQGVSELIQEMYKPILNHKPTFNIKRNKIISKLRGHNRVYFLRIARDIYHQIQELIDAQVYFALIENPELESKLSNNEKTTKQKAEQRRNEVLPKAGWRQYEKPKNYGINETNENKQKEIIRFRRGWNKYIASRNQNLY